MGPCTRVHAALARPAEALPSRERDTPLLVGRRPPGPGPPHPKHRVKASEQDTGEQTQEWARPRGSYFGSDKTFWILTFRVCFLDFLWSRGVCGILGWLAGKVAYRCASFPVFKKTFWIST